ncbi:MAG: PAS domain-containing sensor histidine kinase [Bacteroidales bacterium]|nr:PAS domain-containing sensor histidine kinase [Bacteroidales bacterium]
MAGRLKNILKYIFDGDESRSLEKRLLQSVMFIGMLIALIGVIVSLFVNSSPAVLTLAATMFLSLTLIYHLVRFKNLYKPVILPLIIISYLAIAALWIFDGGLDGSTIIIAYVVFILTLIIVRDKKKIPVLLVFILLLIMLYLLELYRPEWIDGFSSEQERWTDSIITAVYCAVFIFLIIRFLHRNYTLERQKAEESEARIRSIMENSADAIFLTDRKGKYLYSNKAASRLLGYSPKEIMNITIADISPPEKLDEHREIFSNILNRGSRFIEIELKKKDGNYVPVDLNAVLLPDGRVYGSCRDISVRKKALDAIVKNENRLKELNADKDLFISIMSHDLKGPFQNIMGLSEMLREEINTMEKKEIEKVIVLMESTSKKTYELFEDLLKWARSQQGKIPFEPVFISVEDILTDAVELLKSKAGLKNISLDYYTPPGLKIFADADMIKTVLRNLLSNAIKFTGENGSVIVLARTTGQGVSISVKDNGKGIEEENIPKLFDISQTFSTEGTRREKGTGLGLLLCKDFTEKHGGKISVESTPGKGSEFTVYLPDRQ